MSDFSKWKASDYTSYKTVRGTDTKTRAEIFTANKMHEDMNPLGVKMREARDSDVNPESTAIIVGVDVTGSMGSLAEILVKEDIHTLFDEILERKPVTDPQIMAMAIGDVDFDSGPLQVGQFESNIVAMEWLEKIFLEGGGGYNDHESYDMPAYFAANHTSIDCWEKRRKKGYLFTMGDEPPPEFTLRHAVKKFIGDDIQANIPYADVIEAASRMYHVFHLIIAQGSHARSYGPETIRQQWNEYLGQRALILEDTRGLAEVIVSAIEVTEGRDKEEVIKSWSGDTSMTVATAIKDLTPVTDFDNAIKVVKF